MKQIELKKEEIQKLKTEIRTLEAKLQKLDEQIAAKANDLERTRHDYARFLAQNFLDEKTEQTKSRSFQQTIQQKELELMGLNLAREELEKRLEQAREALQKALLQLFCLYRDHFLSQLEQDFKSYNQAVIDLSKREARINSTLIWLRKWEEALARKLQRLGLEFDKAARTLGPLGASQLLDSSLSYVEDGTIPQVKDLDELVRQGKVTIPVEESFTQVIPPIHSMEENFWPTLERALGLE